LCIHSIKIRPGQARLHLMLVVMSQCQTRNDCAAHAACTARVPSKSVAFGSNVALPELEVD